MRRSASVLGIIGGIIALVIGVIAFFIADLAQNLGIEEALSRQVLSLVLPIAALIGAGISPRSGVIGGLFMLGGAVGILLVLRIGFLSLITAIPIGLGGLLELLGAAVEKEPA